MGRGHIALTPLSAGETVAQGTCRDRARKSRPCAANALILNSCNPEVLKNFLMAGVVSHNDFDFIGYQNDFLLNISMIHSIKP